MKKILVFILSAAISPAFAQQTIRPSIYLNDMNYYNASAISLTDTAERFSTSLYSKYKIVDADNETWNKPPSFMFHFMGKMGKSGSYYSFSYINDDYSFYNRNILYAGYIKQWKWGKTSRLNVGGRAVLNFDRMNWDRLSMPHNESGKGMKFTPDIDLGIQYQVWGLTAGISAKNLLGLSTKLEGYDLLKNRRESYLNVSYLFKIGKILKLGPYLQVCQERNTNLDAGLYITLFNRVSASYLLRVKELRSIYSLDLRLYKQLSIGLAVDHSAIMYDKNVDVRIKYNF